MVRRFALALPVGLFLSLLALQTSIVGCGSGIEQLGPGEGAGGAGGSPEDGGPGPSTTSTMTTSSGPADAFPDYTDPGCPDAGPPLYDYQCDPYAQDNGDCAPGEGCYIYVDYPDEPCGQEIYGAFCAPEGFGQQGEPCGGGFDCAGGFVCVVSGSGTQCVELCSLSGDDGCPPGLVCEPIDVEGFGGCL